MNRENLFRTKTINCDENSIQELTDKNGTKIFEGDIINIKGNPIYDDYKLIDYNAVVIFINGEFCAIDAITEDECAVKRYNFCTKELQIEVIGNIFDNPELMDED